MGCGDLLLPAGTVLVLVVRSRVNSYMADSCLVLVAEGSRDPLCWLAVASVLVFVGTVKFPWWLNQHVLYCTWSCPMRTAWLWRVLGRKKTKTSGVPR